MLQSTLRTASNLRKVRILPRFAEPPSHRGALQLQAGTRQLIVLPGKDSWFESTSGSHLLIARPDIALGMHWPAGIISRVLQNAFTEEWQGREEELRAEVARQSGPFAWTGAHNDRPENMLNWAGESSGLVREVLRQPKSCGARSPRPRTTCAVPAVCSCRKPSPGGGCPRGRSNSSSLPGSFAPPAGVRSARCTRYSGWRRRIRA